MDNIKIYRPSSDTITPTSSAARRKNASSSGVISPVVVAGADA